MKINVNHMKNKISLYYVVIGCFTFIKIILMCLFSSDYQNVLFEPFVMDFINNGGNPYERFYLKGVTNAFPYPMIMLFVESLGVVWIKIFRISNVMIQNFCFKLPSLIIDLLGCRCLEKLCGEKRRYIAVFYYASPIVLYAVYMHGQLDLIPTVFLLIALYYLTIKNLDNKNLILGTLFTIISLLCKLHILAILPIIFLYLLKRENVKRAVLFIIATLCGMILGLLPFWSMGFKKCVLFNAEQSVLTKVYFNFATVEMFIPIAAVLIVYLIAFKLNYMNKDLFINFCGITFCVFLALCPPMPGWFVWIVPFFALLFANSNKEKYKNILIYASMNLWYLVYFILMHEKDLVDLIFVNRPLTSLKMHNATMTNLFFTLMAGTLLYLVYSMYQVGIVSNGLYRRRNVPFTIGISGDSGSGKSTMIGIVEKCLGASNLLYIEGDGDHRWERGDKYWNDYTALNPKANFLYRQAEDLRVLRSGGSVRRVEYNHTTGKFTEPKKIKTRKYLMLCGLHALYLPQIRRNLDLKIYMDSDEVLRRYWKIQRDVKERGHSKENVLKSIEERMPDAEKYIYPQKKYADLIVRYYDKDLTDCMVENYDVKMNVQLSVSAAINIEPLVEELRKNDISIDYDYSEDLQKQLIYIHAENMNNKALPLGRIADTVIPQLEEITKENLDENISCRDSIVILFLLLVISYKMQGVS